MQQELTVLTPEKAVVTYRLASLGTRVVAHVVDLVIFVGLTIALSFGIARISGGQSIEALSSILLVWVSLGPFAYFILLEGLWNGQTPGKRVNGLRVRMADGTPVTFVGAMGRNLIRPADMLPGPYLVGVVAMFLNPRSQRLGDLVANTVVIYDRRPEKRFVAAPHHVGIHALESHVGDLVGMTREEYEALRRFCDRWPELSQATQQRLLTEVWAPIATRRNIPATDNIHPIYLAEATVMKYGRQNGLL